ncbi:MAG: AarF/ABC1/UbiB kinase family protein [Lachnospiraceae bacterium]|nr:AarF/ABC1/UbiB kinase family protein [Lachnospiraceae bacterium]
MSDVREKARSLEILGVFSKHNFYAGGFTPEEMRTTLEDLGPTYVKIGQIMSSRTDILPKAYCRELEKLRSEVRPLAASEARRVIEEETGKKIEEIYEEFRDEPLGSASIAQAHYGVLKDGTRVVTKVQRPGIARMMRRDFALLKKLAGAVNIAGEADDTVQAVDLKTVVEELEKVSEEELDFRVEAANTRLFKEKCIEDETLITCPTIIDELTTERILTMTFVDGYSIAKRDRLIADGCDCEAIAKTIVGNYLHQVLDVGIFHGDPHQGNIMISKGVPYWIDFGMIGRVSESSIASLQDTILAMVQKNTEAMADSALSMGIVKGKVNKTRLMEDIDAMLGRYVSVKSLSEMNLGKLMTELTDLLSNHNIVMPGEYTMLVRSLVTVEGVLEALCPELNLFDFLSRKMTERIRQNFDVQTTVAELIQTLTTVGTQTTRIPSMVFDVLRNLVKGRMKINLELTGYEELLEDLNGMVLNIVLAVFACVLFTGSCILCTTNIQPQAGGMPIMSLIGFVVSVALGIYTVQSMSKKK